MFTLAARRMGYRINVFAPEDDTPAGQIAYREVRAPYTDLDAVRRFASEVSVVTFEFENVPHETAEAAAEHAHVRPAGRVLHVAQNREREKTFLARAGLPVPRFEVVRSAADLDGALGRLGCPAILKTARFGYDGKGQSVLRDAEDLERSWQQLGDSPLILEAFVPFEAECSLIGVRARDGETRFWPLTRNVHANGILALSLPGVFAASLQEQAEQTMTRLMEHLDYTGVLTMEFFLRGGELLFNEFAPRVHNSGHWTEAACHVSQFEQHIRAIAGWPLGDTRRHSDCVMENLLGDEIEATPDLTGIPGTVVHDYGKAEVRQGRKMGHVTRLKLR